MNAEFDWEWQGIIFLSMPLAFADPLIVRVVPDIFADYTDEQLDQVFAVMALTPQHTYQVLTKRPKRMLKYMENLDLRKVINAAADLGLFLPSGQYSLKIPLKNIWLGVTVENQATADERIPLLLKTPAAVRFLSCEPLLEDVDVSRWLYPVFRTVNGTGFLNAKAKVGTSPNANVSWVIVGGESGPGARPCDIAWVRSIVKQCKAANVPCFVKQLGHRPYLDDNRYCVSGKGNIPDEWPECIRVRQTPSLEVTA